MNKVYKSAVIGGGASGLLCAVELLNGDNAFCGAEVVVVERNDRVGKKLLATGNGQGNLTNAEISPDRYYGEKNFIKAFFSDATSVEEYFYSLGIPLCEGEYGKKYPLSRQASSVTDILRRFLEYNNCEIKTGERALKIIKRNGIFEIKTEKGSILSETVVLAVGGSSGKQFGTDGTSYNLAENFKHKLTPLHPSLVQLKTETGLIRGLKGLKEIATVTLIDGEKSVKTATGDILFTDYGVSGDTVFKVSSAVEECENPVLKISFLPCMSEKEIEKVISDRLKINYIPKEEVYNGLINKQVGKAVLKTCKSASAEGLAEALKDFRLKITGTLGFDYSQVTKGGIVTDDVNPFTMQSKLEKGLYVVGEMLNVDGDCGGFNLTFAFLSGIKSAKSIKENKSKKNSK